MPKNYNVDFTWVFKPPHIDTTMVKTLGKNNIFDLKDDIHMEWLSK